MTIPASTRIIEAFAAALGTIPGVAIISKITRDEDVAEAQRPAVVIRMVDQDFEPFEGGSTLHTCSVDIDLWVEAAVMDAITDAHADLAAKVVAIIASCREPGQASGTLGDLCQTLEEKSLTAEIDSIPELGAAVLTLAVQYLTPRGDFYTINGHSGPVV